MAVIGMVWWASGGFTQSLKRVALTEFAMNTNITITVYAASQARGEQAIRKAFEEINRIERVLEPLKGDGDLKRINAGPDGAWWPMNPDLRVLIERSRYYYTLSEGAFDPTIGPVKWLWDFENGGKIPDSAELAKTLPLVGFDKIEVKGDRFRFVRPGMKLDFGAIAKGYAVDRMADVLKANGVTSALINAGGNIITIGKKPGNADWIIGVRHPRQEKTVRVEPEPYPAVATSGDYERFFFKDGVRYHHILDPKTGWPSRKCISATAWTTNATNADALSTTMIVLGPDKGIALAKRLGNVEVLFFFERNGRIETAASPGVAGRVKE